MANRGRPGCTSRDASSTSGCECTPPPASADRLLHPCSDSRRCARLRPPDMAVSGARRRSSSSVAAGLWKHTKWRPDTPPPSIPNPRRGKPLHELQGVNTGAMPKPSYCNSGGSNGTAVFSTTAADPDTTPLLSSASPVSPSVRYSHNNTVSQWRPTITCTTNGPNAPGRPQSPRCCRFRQMPVRRLLYGLMCLIFVSIVYNIVIFYTSTFPMA
ncbi:hypothetical protein B566_EDAN013598 [Ephemera danica]|nr:hypothetical protein B566_EDAN013598 [Ephemera danica]